LLPSYDLYRRLHKLSDSNSPLSIGYRLASTAVQSNAEISLGKTYFFLYSAWISYSYIYLGSTILENDARKPTVVYNFTDIVSPMG
jgi:hypothetical protein